jgi:hypothetical protein
MSFFSTKEEVSVIEKENVFISCSSVCVFVNSSTESLFALVFFVSVLSCLIFCVESSAVLSSKRSEIVQREEIMFLDEKFVIKSDVSDFCETNNSSFSSLNKFCVRTIEIEKKKEEKKRFDFEFFAIDFVLSCCHVNEIENFRSVIALMKKIENIKKLTLKKRRKKE